MPNFNLRRILVPVDFSECASHAFDYAIGVAEPFNAALTLLHVVEPAAAVTPFEALTPAVDATHQRLLEAGRDRLVALCERHVGHRPGVETLVRMGWAPSEIADTAKALGTDLIIMGSHGSSGLKSILLGSTAEKVVRHATCPVLTVRCWGE